MKTTINATLSLFALTLVSASIILIAGLETGCGTNPSPGATAFSNGAVPNKFESTIYDIHTNVVTVTNLVPVAVPVFHTNEVTLTITNQQNQVITTFSNVVNQIWETNQVPMQQEQTNYTRTTKASVASDVQAGTSVLNAFVPGTGNLAYAGIMGILGALAWFRSSKQGTNNTTALAQEIETIRTFVQNLPNGQAYDAALTNFLQSHQAEAGVTQSVVSVLENYVSNPDAKVAAQSVVDAINALKTTTAPLPNIVPTANT